MMLKILQGRGMKLKRNMGLCRSLRNRFVKKTRVKTHLRWGINQFKENKKTNQAQSLKTSSETNLKNSHLFNHLQPFNRQNNNQAARSNSSP
jgi:hypothetical protein